jgi:stage V sporulation protein K
LADRFPHALYSAGLDPNELEIAFSESKSAPDTILMEAVKRRVANIIRDTRGAPLTVQSTVGGSISPRDRVEDLLGSIVGLEHIKSQVRGLRRSAEISDLKESLLPAGPGRRGQNPLALISPALSESTGRPRASAMVFVGNPGTGKTAVARLLAKVYHELGLLRKPKFLEVERMDLVGRDKEQTVLKTREVLDEARGGILFIDEAYTLGMASKRSKMDTGNDAMTEIMKSMDEAVTSSDAADNHPLVILAGFTVEMQTFLIHQSDLRKKFPITFEFPDYSCQELARIFIDLASAKGFDLDDNVTEDWIASKLEQETTVSWRGERNGRVCEQLMAGCRTQVRRRMKTAQMEDDDEFDPHLIIRSDIESVMTVDFK